MSFNQHESYQQGAGAFPNDIAVIGTPGADMSDYVIALAEANDDFSGQDCTISGWGRLTGMSYTIYEPCHETTCLRRFATRFGSNQSVQPHRLFRGLALCTQKR